MPATGPHLAVAVFCERVITEGDGMMSIIRMVDRVIQTATGPEPPEEMPPFVVEDLQLVIALRADRARGRYTLKFVIEDPGGMREQVAEQDINLQPGNVGVNLSVPVKLGLQHEGVYWVDVILGGPHGQEDELLTRVPLEAVYQRQRSPAPRDQSQ